MNRTWLYALLLLLCFPCVLLGQGALEPYKVGEGWYRNDEGTDLPAADFIATYGAEWGLTDTDSLQLVEERTDSLGYTHYRYRQYYQNYEVEHTDFFLHYRDGLWITANALVVSNLTLSVDNPITEEDGLMLALDAVHADEYAWENAEMEAEIKAETGDESATYYPSGKLLLHHPYGQPLTNEVYRFAWRFEVNTVEPFGHEYVYVDAQTGEMLGRYSQLISCNNKPATCTTLYNGNQNITAKQRGSLYNNDFVLEECGDRKIHTKWGWGLNPDVTDDNGNWGTDDMSATSAHWAAERTWDYYKIRHNRNGCNNAGRELKLLADETHANAVDNAYYHLSAGNNDKIHIGKWTSNNNSLASVDIVGHEFTHGVTQSTANLVYQGESGALNESFSDIFGTMVEREIQPSVDWLIGDDTGIPFRSMQAPTLFNDPDNYQGAFWASTSQGAPDNGGVHSNSGVQNRFYFLLCQGGTQNGMTVLGLSPFVAEKIAYRALDEYMQQNSQYADARNAWINAAIDLHGACSFQTIQVMNAWRAVGVNGTGTPPVCIQLLNPPGKQGVSYCSNTPITLTATTNIVPPVTYNWTVPAGVVISNQTGGQATFGSLTVPQVSISVSATNGNVTTNTVTKTYATKVCRLPAPGWNPTEPENPEGGIRLYPNPASDRLTIEIEAWQYEGGSLTLTDMQGRTVWQQTLLQAQSEISTSRLAPGIYTAHIQLPHTSQIIRLEIAK